MSLAKVTIIGQEQFLRQNENQSLFDLLQLPAGIDKDLLADNILLTAGDFESLYDNPYFFRNMISVWGRKWYRTFDKWITVLNEEYDPLENYDRKEFWEDQGKMNRKESTDTTDNLAVSQAIQDAAQTITNSTSNTSTTDTQNSESNDTQNSESNDTQNSESNDTQNSESNDTQSVIGSTDTTTENTVSAYDSATYQPADKSVSEVDNTSDTSARTTSNSSARTTSNSSARTTVALTGQGTDTNASHSQVDSTDTNNLTRQDARTIADVVNENRGDNNEHRGRIHGNIGVKTSQSMLAEELEVQRFNIINEITDIFITEFCVLVYD